MKQNQHPVVTTLRWLIFIPCGVAAGALAGAALLLIFGGGSWLAGMRFDAPINIFMASICSGYASVAAGARVAPSEKKTIPVVVVGVIMLFIAGGAILIRMNRGEWFRSADGLCVAVGTAVAMVTLIKEDKK